MSIVDTVGIRREVEQKLNDLGLHKLSNDVCQLTFNAVTNLSWLLEQNSLCCKLLKKQTARANKLEKGNSK